MPAGGLIHNPSLADIPRYVLTKPGQCREILHNDNITPSVVLQNNHCIWYGDRPWYTSDVICQQRGPYFAKIRIITCFAQRFISKLPPLKYKTFSVCVSIYIVFERAQDKGLIWGLQTSSTYPFVHCTYDIIFHLQHLVRKSNQLQWIETKLYILPLQNLCCELARWQRSCSCALYERRHATYRATNLHP